MDLTQIRDQIYEALTADDIDATRVPGDEPAVRVVPDALGTDGDRSVVMDIIPADVFDGRVYVTFVTSIAYDVPEDCYVDVCCELNALNMESSIGAYVLFEEGLLVHRHSLSAPPDDLLPAVAAAMADILEQINGDMETLTDIVQ